MRYVTNPELHDLFAPEQITDRFNNFVGIIRRVSPEKTVNVKVYDQELDYAVNVGDGILLNLKHIVHADRLNKSGGYWMQSLLLMEMTRTSTPVLTFRSSKGNLQANL